MDFSEFQSRATPVYPVPDNELYAAVATPTATCEGTARYATEEPAMIEPCKEHGTPAGMACVPWCETHRYGGNIQQYLHYIEGGLTPYEAMHIHDRQVGIEFGFAQIGEMASAAFQ